MILEIIFWILLVVLGLPAAYMLVFSVASKFYRPRKEKPATAQRRYVILVPAYKSDAFIRATALAARGQDYPADKYRVLVIADSMKDESLEPLPGLGVEVLKVSLERSSKAASLRKAMEWLGPDAADEVVILDSDNIIAPDFLSKADALVEGGAVAIQAHRTAKNLDTPVAVLDAATEEINNAIFRAGHCALGISSALIGSGIVLPFDWFSRTSRTLDTSAEDKELELALLHQGIFVDYAPDIPVLDEKTRTAANYQGQRRRWQASNFFMMSQALGELGTAKDKVGYFDKIFQWCLPSRMIVLAGLPVFAIIATILGLSSLWAWWGAFAALLLALLLGLPRSLMGGRLLRAMVKVPQLALINVLNLFHLKGTKHTYIHTEHQ